MEIYIINNTTMQTESVISEYKSLTWNEKFAEYGDFTLILNCTQEIYDTLKVNYFVKIKKSTKWMIIESINIDCEEDGTTEIEVKGSSLEKILSRRVVLDKYDSTGTEVSLVYSGEDVNVVDGKYYDRTSGTIKDDVNRSYIKLGKISKSALLYIWNNEVPRIHCINGENNKQLSATTYEPIVSAGNCYCILEAYTVSSSSPSITYRFTAPTVEDLPTYYMAYSSSTPSQESYLVMTGFPKGVYSEDKSYAYFDETFTAMSSCQTVYIGFNINSASVQRCVKTLDDSTQYDTDYIMPNGLTVKDKSTIENNDILVISNSDYDYFYGVIDLPAPLYDEESGRYYQKQLIEKENYLILNCYGSALKNHQNGISIMYDGKGELLGDAVNNLITQNCIEPVNNGSSASIIPTAAGTYEAITDTYSIEYRYVTEGETSYPRAFITPNNKCCIGYVQLSPLQKVQIHLSTEGIIYNNIYICSSLPVITPGATQQLSYAGIIDRGNYYTSRFSTSKSGYYTLQNPTNSTYYFLFTYIGRKDELMTSGFEVTPYLWSERVIPNLDVKPLTDYLTTSIVRKLYVSVTYFGENLYDAIKEICDKRNIGFSLSIDSFDVSTGTYHMLFQINEGTDRTSSQSENPIVTLSTKTGDLASGTFKHDVSKLKNAAVFTGVDFSLGTINLKFAGACVYGNGGDIQYSELNQPTGLNRYEIGIDANKIQSVIASQDWSNLAATKAKKSLTNKAKETFKSNKETKKFSGEINRVHSYEYGTDYFLGDKVTVKYPYGQQEDCTVTTWTIVDEADEYSELPIFEQINPDEDDIVI